MWQPVRRAPLRIVKPPKSRRKRRHDLLFSAFRWLLGLAGTLYLAWLLLFPSLSGSVGRWAEPILRDALGISAFLVPVFLLSLLWRYFSVERRGGGIITAAGALASLAAAATLLSIFSQPAGGALGRALSGALASALGSFGAFALALAALLLCLQIVFEIRWSKLAAQLARLIAEDYRQWQRSRRELAMQLAGRSASGDLPIGAPAGGGAGPSRAPVSVVSEPQPPEPKKREKPAEAPRQPSVPRADSAYANYVAPAIELLNPPPSDKDRGKPLESEIASAIAELERTLTSFGVQAKVTGYAPGPVITRYELAPAPGVKVSQIVALENDIALAMKAKGIRIIAPIPGKAAVGIEIPNPSAQIVRLKEVLVGAGERLNTPLSVVLGKDVVGQPVVIDLAAQPHLLVAGSTGSGKSVCLNAIICNLLLRNDPSRVRLVLIDPKMLEMSVYNGIPHLLLPVVTDPKEALRALKWMEAQMDHRYRRLARHSVRNIEGYNAKVAKGEIVTEEGETVTEPMPYYLTIVDELADLMMQLGQDFELPITRLAQKARAVGIHLILATQRPSVDVLTGVIKANIPCRIAFRVIQKNDSRTILDLNGAERLLGHGDMLYLQPGRALPVRVHGAFLELEECEAIVAHWRRFADLTRPVQLAEEREGGESDVRGEDDLFEAARRVVVLHQSGSTSLLQRRLRVGYTRAGRLMDMLEEAGVVGPFTGSKARDVLLRPEELGETADPLALEEEE